MLFHYKCTLPAASLYLLDRSKYDKKRDADPFPDPQPYKQLKRIRDEEKIPAAVKETFVNQIVDFTLYDAENCQTKKNFEPIQMNTHCTFAKKAVLWGARDYDTSLSIGTCVHCILCYWFAPKLVRFNCYAQSA